MRCRTEELLANLARYDFTNATRQTPLPRIVGQSDRFMRSANYLQMQPEPKFRREAISAVLAWLCRGLCVANLAALSSSIG
ncbi:hypothetical protein [Uliginosibacterium sp. TH139]|uniref:hypothetical protein n=1 Tax=Uliginosibacterium sp. TH139 TaxID=2067453 RepID=UPI000C7A63A3|nr:hypothetical protein [Uliginosibacterium sp. TH139]PLK48084.1 hypothetical protein C0V76_12640 [Uliginosibacterium sp. TH139]